MIVGFDNDANSEVDILMREIALLRYLDARAGWHVDLLTNPITKPLTICLSVKWLELGQIVGYSEKGIGILIRLPQSYAACTISPVGISTP